MAERPDSLGAVLALVRELGRPTRLQLTEESGLSRKVVSQRLDELMLRGLVVEGPRLQSTGGRAPRTFQFCSTAGYLLAVQFGGTSVAVGLTDLECSIVDEIIEPAEMSETVEQRAGRVEDLIDTLLDRHPECRPLRGMGVGIFASVDSRTGLPNEELNVLGWGGYPIRERWESRYDVPVRVDNEVNMMALGELLGGVAQGHDTVLQVKVGSGIGAGIVVDGRLVRGVRGMAGEIGHIRVPGGSARCVCGGSGCLAVEAGGVAIAIQAVAEAERSPYLYGLVSAGRTVTAAQVGAGAALGDPVCVDVLRRAGRRIGTALAAVVTILDPSVLVLGGGVTAAGPVLLAPIEQEIRDRVPRAVSDRLHVVHSPDHDRTGLVGAACSVAQDLMATEALERWGSPAVPRRAAADTRAAQSRMSPSR